MLKTGSMICGEEKKKSLGLVWNRICRYIKIGVIFLKVLLFYLENKESQSGKIQNNIGIFLLIVPLCIYAEWKNGNFKKINSVVLYPTLYTLPWLKWDQLHVTKIILWQKSKHCNNSKGKTAIIVVHFGLQNPRFFFCFKRNKK